MPLNAVSRFLRNLPRVLKDGFNYIRTEVKRLPPSTLHHAHLLCMTLLTLGVLAVALVLLAKPGQVHSRNRGKIKAQTKQKQNLRRSRTPRLSRSKDSQIRKINRDKLEEKRTWYVSQRNSVTSKNSFRANQQREKSNIGVSDSFKLSPGTAISRRFLPINLIPSTPHTWSIDPASVQKKQKFKHNSAALEGIPKDSERNYSNSTVSNTESLLRKFSLNGAAKDLSKRSNTSVYMGDYYAKLSSEQQKVLKAIRDDRLDVLALYKRNGMDFRFNGNNPLREAVLSNKVEILKFLYNECGIDLNSESGFAIRWASRKDHVEMVEWLCTLDCIDVTACGAEALLWARENYHFSVEEILEDKVKKYERAHGIEEGWTLKQAHQKRRRRELSRHEDIRDRSLLTTEFELAREQASAHKRNIGVTRLKDPSFRVPKEKQYLEDSFYGAYSAHENRQTSLATPRTRLKNHCHQAAEKLGTLPCDPPTEHRMKIARMRKDQEQDVIRKNKARGSKRGKHPSNRDKSKRKINTKQYQCTPIMKKRKIRPRSDGPITRTQHKGFIGMRDELWEKGIMSLDIREDLKNEELEQMMHLGTSFKTKRRLRKS